MRFRNIIVEYTINYIMLCVTNFYVMLNKYITLPHTYIQV